MTIPGISLIGAEQILAEIGTDMTVFAGWVTVTVAIALAEGRV